MKEAEARPLRLGLPLWGQADWKGSLYPVAAKPREFLAHYARVMDAVEGNTTFYSLPSEASVARWRELTPEHFLFSFKFPRTVTHDRALRGAERETGAFLERLAPLGSRLGRFLLQFPKSFGPGELPRLDAFLERLPQTYRYAVEVRHPGFFSRSGAEQLEAVLRARGAERVVMDSRGMRAGDPTHPDVRAAAHEKPDVPVAMRALSDTPIVRFVAHPTASVNAPFLMRWADVLAAWLAAGRRPTFFMHCPNNAHSPALALWLDRLVRIRVRMRPLSLPEASDGQAEEGISPQLSLI